MIQLSFPTRKLGQDILRVNDKYKDVKEAVNTTVLGVTNSEGITITGNKASDDLSKYIVIKGKQFAYNPYRVNVGSIGLTDDEQEGLVSPAYIVFKTRDTLVPEFLLYYLKSSIGLNLIRWYGNRGGVRDALRFDDLCKIDIPDLSVEQQLVALKNIKEVEEKVILLNKEINQQLVLLEKYKDSVLMEAIQGKLLEQNNDDEPAAVLLDKLKHEKVQLIKEKKIKKEKNLSPNLQEDKHFELPKSWEWIRFGDIMESIRYGTSKKCEYDNQGIPVLRIPNIKNSLIDHAELKYTELTDNEYSELKLEKGDLLLIRSNGSTSLVGRSAIIRESENGFCFAGYLIRVKLFKKYVSPEFIVMALDSLLVRQQIERPIRTTSGVKNINTTEIKNLILPLPPLDEQIRIVNKVEDLRSLSKKLEQTIESNKQESENLMKAVLQEAFSLAKQEVVGSNN